MPSRYTTREWACKGRCCHVSYCSVKLWVKRLTALARCRSSHQRLAYFPYLLSTHPSNEHLGESFCHLGFIAVVAFKSLGVKLSFSISGDVELFDGTRRSQKRSGVAAIAISPAFFCRLSPGGTKKLSQFFPHDFFHHRLHGTPDLLPQILMKGEFDFSLR